MCTVSLNYNTFDKEFYDRRFCEFQIKEWNKNLKYYTRKMEKTKTEDLKKRFYRETEKARKQLIVYDILIKYIYDKPYDKRTDDDQYIAVSKIKEVLKS